MVDFLKDIAREKEMARHTHFDMSRRNHPQSPARKLGWSYTLDFDTMGYRPLCEVFVLNPWRACIGHCVTLHVYAQDLN
jgi:hypothetical protein